jgi:hypothetical protein
MERSENIRAVAPEQRTPPEVLSVAQVESVCAAAGGRAEEEARKAIASIFAIGGTESDIAAARTAGTRYADGVAEAAERALAETHALFSSDEVPERPGRTPEFRGPDVESMRTEFGSLRTSLETAASLVACQEVLLATEKFLDELHNAAVVTPDAQLGTLLRDAHTFLLDEVFGRYGELDAAERTEVAEAADIAVPEDLAAYGTERDTSGRSMSELVTLLSDRAASLEEASRHCAEYPLREQESLLRMFGETTAPYLRELQRMNSAAHRALIEEIGGRWSEMKAAYRTTERRFWNAVEETGMTREEYRGQFVDGAVTVGELLRESERRTVSESERALSRLVAQQGPKDHDQDTAVDEFLKTHLRLQ